MTHYITNTGLAWISLRLPAHLYAIPMIQQTLCSQAQHWGFAPSTVLQMELAVEEAITTILQLTHGEHAIDAQTPSAGHFDIRISVLDHALQLRITDYDLPYDLSMIPLFSPSSSTDSDNKLGLSFYLLSQLVDGLQVHHPGIQGQSLELEWKVPAISSTAMPSTPERMLSIEPSATDIQIRPLADSDAIYVARLMHQNYGYSYVNPDLYIAERIVLRTNDGRLSSMVAVDAQQQVVGHCALMKTTSTSSVVELGAAVVSPAKQGLGIFNRLWQSLEDQLPQRAEYVACVHAVTSHPFTQKTVLRHGYVMSALLLAYTPLSLQFKSVSDKANAERGSVYYCCKLLQPLAPLLVYVPEPDRDLVLELAQQLQMPLQCVSSHSMHLDTANTVLHYHLESSLNSAFMHCDTWAADGALELTRLWKYLCRERVDTLYFSIDLTQAHAPALAQQLRRLGFISAGLTPYMPYPATLLLQYINNQTLSEQNVVAVGENAEKIKQRVFAEYKQNELLA